MEKREAHRGWHTWVSSENKSIWINKSSVNPKSTSNQSSKPCTVLQYPSRIGTPGCRASTNHRGGSSRCSRQKCRVFGLRYWQCVLHVPAALCLRVAVGVAGYCSAMCVLQCVCCSVCVAVCVLQYLCYGTSRMRCACQQRQKLDAFARLTFPRVTWLNPMCDMTSLCVWHDIGSACQQRQKNSHLRVWHSPVWHDSFLYVTWLICVCDNPPCDMTHSYMWHD